MSKISIENFSPLDPIDTILSGAPGLETAMALTMPPEISLFEPNSKNANTVKARKEHDEMRETFQNQGIQSYNMREVIAVELANNYQLAINSRENFLIEVRKRAYFLHQKYQMPIDFEQIVSEAEALFDEDVRTMGLEAAIAINGVLSNILDTRGRFKEFSPDLPPAANFLFWRDTSHITGQKIGTHKMFLPIRDQEVVLAEIGFQALGIEYQPVIKNGRGSIEGGDILPMQLNNQLYSLIGTAERTSWEAVKAWFTLHEASFSASGDGIIPLVIEGPNSGTQDQMHIDTFSQQIAPGAIIHCGEITNKRQISVLMRQKGQIIKVQPENLTDGTYKEWIESQATNVYDMTVNEQLLYAPNVLVHGSNTGDTTVFVTRDGTPKVTKFIQKHALKTVLLKMNDLTNFYGGAHCATQEIRKRG